MSLRAALWGLALLVLPGAAAAAPNADLWPHWQAHEPSNAATIDHRAWTAFLDEYRRMGPNGVARVDYGAVGKADRQKLDSYIARLEGVDIAAYNRDVQFAYWVNLYNAVTVELILEHYPVATIRDISPGSFLGGLTGSGPWDAKLVQVDGKKLSLNDIEHRILRPIWQDPRIHYVVNCASIGCPNLAADAFRAADLERDLTRAARRYINHPRGAKLDGQGRLIVSKIYTWYREDFGGTDRGVIQHLRRYANAELKAQLAGVESIHDSRYNWQLNDVAAGGS